MTRRDPMIRGAALVIALAALLAGCSRQDFMAKSPVPGCYADCPIRSPEEQEDSLRTPEPDARDVPATPPTSFPTPISR